MILPLYLNASHLPAHPNPVVCGRREMLLRAASEQYSCHQLQGGFTQPSSSPKSISSNSAFQSVIRPTPCYVSTASNSACSPKAELPVPPPIFADSVPSPNKRIYVPVPLHVPVGQAMTPPPSSPLFLASQKAAERIVEEARSISPARPLPPPMVPAQVQTATTSTKRKLKAKRPFPCPSPGCCKSFLTSASLQRHERVHSGERAFPCPICNQRFGTLSHQKRHLRVHTGERPFVCQECHQCFSTSASLKRHRALPFCCQLCFKRFSLEDGLERHMMKHADDATS